MIPFVYLFVFLKVDPRIRTASSITEVLELPLLAIVPHMPSPKAKTPWYHNRSAIIGVVTAVCLLYVVVYILKLSFESAGGAL